MNAEEIKIEKQMLEFKYQFLLKASQTIATKTPCTSHFLAFQTKQLLDISQVTSDMSSFYCSNCYNWLSSRGSCCVRLYGTTKRSKKTNNNNRYRQQPGEKKKRLWLITTCRRCQTKRKDNCTRLVSLSSPSKQISSTTSTSLSNRKSLHTTSRQQPQDKPTSSIGNSFLFATH